MGSPAAASSVIGALPEWAAGFASAVTALGVDPGAHRVVDRVVAARAVAAERRGWRQGGFHQARRSTRRTVISVTTMAPQHPAAARSASTVPNLTASTARRRRRARCRGARARCQWRTRSREHLERGELRLGWAARSVIAGAIRAATVDVDGNVGAPRGEAGSDRARAISARIRVPPLAKPALGEAYIGSGHSCNGSGHSGRRSVHSDWYSAMRRWTPDSGRSSRRSTAAHRPT